MARAEKNRIQNTDRNYTLFVRDGISPEPGETNRQAARRESNRFLKKTVFDGEVKII